MPGRACERSRNTECGSPPGAFSRAMRTPLVLITVLLAACGASTPEPTSPPAPARSALPAIDWAAHGLDENGCFLVRDVRSGEEIVSDEARCRLRRRPYSTFKIANALIGLDAGLLEGADAAMPWDRERYPAEEWWFEAWRRDHTLRSAMEVSAVPAFRLLATRIGIERMRTALERLGYGNADVSGPEDAFWLEGGALRISAYEQVDLLVRLVEGTLPLRPDAQAAMREVLRRGEGHYGKTGSGPVEDAAAAAPGEGPFLGWMVGWLELDDRTLVYAMWVEGDGYRATAERRSAVLDAVLAELGSPRAER